MRPPHLAHSTASSWVLKRAVWPGGGASSGTAAVSALASLAEGRGAEIAGCAFLVELAFLNCREPLAGYDVHSLISYDAE